MTTDVTDASPLAAATDVELLSFRIGENEYSVDIMAVREIRGWTRATSLPHSPSYVRGVINLRGAVLPVIDLALRLGLTVEDPSERNVIIVVDIGGRTIGLRVDAVSDILSFPKDELQDPPEMTADRGQAFVRALTVVEGRMIRILDLAAVVPSAKDTAA
ncbi:MAG: chemotaxis protein CheW [Pseudomonadota bacterium]